VHATPRIPISRWRDVLEDGFSDKLYVWVLSLASFIADDSEVLQQDLSQSRSVPFLFPPHCSVVWMVVFREETTVKLLVDNVLIAHAAKGCCLDGAMEDFKKKKHKIYNSLLHTS
jgi:hypothetical protein